MTDKPLFRFKGRAVIRRDDPYFYTRWDKARPVSVLAHTENEADQKLIAMLPEVARHAHWSWKWDSTDEERSQR